MSRDGIDFATGWAKIKEIALDKLELQLEEGFSKTTKAFSNAEYMSVYHICYHMCTQRHPANYSEQLYLKHGEVITQYLTNKVTPRLREKRDAFLLDEFVYRWENHKIMNKWLAKFFVYVNRYYVEHNNKQSLTERGIAIFKKEVFDVVFRDVTVALLAIIARERNGEAVDRTIIKRCAEIYEAAGEGDLDVYEATLEAPLIAESKTYFRSRAEVWLLDNVPTYLAQVEEVLVAEAGRVQTALVASTESKLLHALEGVLLIERAPQLLENESSGLRAQLREERREDLARLYRLFNRTDNGISAVARLFSTHVRDAALAIVKEREEVHAGHASSSASVPAPVATGVVVPSSSSPLASDLTSTSTVSAVGATATMDVVRDEVVPGSAPVPAATSKKGGKPGVSGAELEAADASFVHAMLALHDRMSGFVMSEFGNNAAFQKALKDAFEVAINRPVQAKASNAEAIAGYCDCLLRTGGGSGNGGGGEKMTDAATEAALDRVIAFFAYIGDKDVFQEIYRSHMSKRLLSGKSQSSDAERSVLSKLKCVLHERQNSSWLRCGAQYTAKMEGMLNDLTTAEEASKQYREFIAAQATSGGPRGAIDFSAQVLTTVWWPTFRNLELKLPPAVADAVDAFTAYYTSKFSSRKLSWQHALGSASVKGTFDKASIELTLVPLQATTLLLFNDRQGPLTFEDIREALGTDVDAAKRVLHSLSCQKLFKVLTKAPESNIVASTDSFTVNTGFSHSLRKVRIPMAQLEQNAQVSKVVDEQRVHAIDAAIVRTMKTRKSMRHTELVAQVSQQLTFFRPQPKDIKKRIEDLIGRDYLERDATDSTLYKYLA